MVLKEQPKPLTISNNYFFSDLSEYDIEYTITGIEKTVANEKIELQEGLPAQSSLQINIPVSEIIPEPGVEYFINFYAKTKQASPAIPAGHIVASEQFRLPVFVKATMEDRLSRSGKGLSAKKNLRRDQCLWRWIYHHFRSEERRSQGLRF